jgi:transcription initiation factor TFIIIB Brf1 subunit/transcription initiation factor TFIIB
MIIDIVPSWLRTVSAIADLGSLRTSPSALNECDHRMFPDPSTGEPTCVECGLVGDAQIVSTDHGSVELGSGRGVGTFVPGIRNTFISTNGRDGQGGRVSKGVQHQLRVSERRAVILSRGRGFDLLAHNELARCAAVLGCREDVKKTALELLIEFRSSRKNCRGYALEDMTLAALIVASRLSRVPVSIVKVSETFKARRAYVTRLIILIQRATGRRAPEPDATFYVRAFARSGGFPPALIDASLRLIAALPFRIGGTTPGPRVVGASAVYLCSRLLGMDRTQEHIGKLFGVLDVSVRITNKAIRAEIESHPGRFPEEFRDLPARVPSLGGWAPRGSRTAGPETTRPHVVETNVS